jgi:hypothetical protein
LRLAARCTGESGATVRGGERASQPGSGRWDQANFFFPTYASSAPDWMGLYDRRL